MFRFKVLFALILVSALGCYADSAAPAVTFLPVKVDFTGVPVGSTSAGTPVTLTNSGNAALTISSIQVNAPFAQINNCPATLNATQSCVIAVSFVPTTAGKVSGTLTVTDNAGGSPHKVPLTGDTITGMNLTVASDGQSSLTVAAGDTATYKLSLTSVGQFAGGVQFKCVGAPALSTCTFDPATVNLTAGQVAPVSVGIKTTGSTASMRPFHSVEIFFALCGAMCFGAVFNLRRKNVKTAMLVGVVGFIGLVGIMSCGGGSKDVNAPTTTPVGTYAVQVIATSGGTEQGLDLTLTVQ